MNLEWVRTFLVAAETENFHKAADRRYISQAAVSQQMARLESVLSAPLFLREGRRVRLSSAGRAFIPFAKRLVETADAGRQRVWTIGAGRQRIFRLAATPLLAESSLLPWLCRQLLLADPSLDLTVTVDAPQAVRAALAAGALDGALVSELWGPAAGATRLLFRDPVYLLAGLEGDHDAPMTDVANLLANRRLIAVSSAPYLAGFLNELENQGRMVATMTVDQPAVAKQLAEQGVGVTLLPHLGVIRELLEGRLYALDAADLPIVPPLPVYWVCAEPTEPQCELADAILRRRWGKAD